MNQIICCKICNYATTSKQSFNSHITHKHHIKSKEYYDLYLKMENEGICQSCGKPTNFRDMWYGYNKHCSKRCIPLDPDVQKKMKNTCQEKYGTTYACQAEQTKEKIKQTTQEHFGVDCYLQTSECRKIIAENSKSKEVKDKIKQTNLEHRGVSCSFQAADVKEKSKKTKIKKYGNATHNNSEKAKKTCLERFGVDNPAKSKIVQDKMKQTCMKKYGVDNVWKSRKIREIAKKKSNKNMHKNGNDSSLEDMLEQLLILHKLSYEKQYNLDSRYPYFCDFYIPSLDCFIEINNYWMHNTHWFDSSNVNDINILNIWKEKSKIHSMYQTAIKVWTDSDVKKRESAKMNNLNYVVLWNTQDIQDWVNSNFELRKDF